MWTVPELQQWLDMVLCNLAAYLVTKRRIKKGGVGLSKREARKWGLGAGYRTRDLGGSPPLRTTHSFRYKGLYGGARRNALHTTFVHCMDKMNWLVADPGAVQNIKSGTSVLVVGMIT